MPLRVSGRNISIGAALQQKITDRVEEAASKYFRGGYSGHATVGKDGFGFRTECVLHLDSGALLEAEGMAPDAYDSAEQAAIRKRVMATVGTIHGNDPTRSARTSELVREIIYEKHVKESNALARRFRRRSD